MGLEAQTLKKCGDLYAKVDTTAYKIHKPSGESHLVSRLRENLTSGSDGEVGNGPYGTAPALYPTKVFLLVETSPTQTWFNGENFI